MGVLEAHSYGDVRMFCFSCHRQLFPTGTKGVAKRRHTILGSRRQTYVVPTLSSPGRRAELDIATVSLESALVCLFAAHMTSYDLDRMCQASINLHWRRSSIIKVGISYSV
jgi:hypothetical protein